MSERMGISEGERLQKVLARAGYGSRRACEELMLQRRVRVNGRVANELGMRVRHEDSIVVDGKPLPLSSENVYLMLSKPRGYLTTARDQRGRPTVLDLVDQRERLFPVGRLDADSEGLLLLTNDGDLAHRMTHPRFGLEKEYRVLVGGHPTDEELCHLAGGVVVEGRPTAPAQVSRLETLAAGTWLRVIVHEGRKRQIRKMCQAVGLVVNRLIRTRVGPLALGTLPQGQWRALTETEVRSLWQSVGGHSSAELVIAIDGPAGSGKSSLAELLAKRRNLLYLDTGAMYRAVTLVALRLGIRGDDCSSLGQLAARLKIAVEPPTIADGRLYTVRVDEEDVTWDLFTPEVGRFVSIVSAVPKVREILARRQREMAHQGSSVVVGRDIGTVVVPDAPIKIFLEASPEVRALRREAQLRARGIMVRREDVLEEIRLRDELDSQRRMSPLVKAQDAVLLNSDAMSVEEEAAIVERLIDDFRCRQERE